MKLQYVMTSLPYYRSLYYTDGLDSPMLVAHHPAYQTRLVVALLSTTTCLFINRTTESAVLTHHPAAVTGCMHRSP
jgi:hypothetical protein